MMLFKAGRKSAAATRTALFRRHRLLTAQARTMATTTKQPTQVKVKIVEVGPRDGLQNEANPVTTDQKVELIQRLAKAGCAVIEAGAFVSPKWVPQMADSAEVFQRLSFPENTNRPLLSCLVPNIKGLEQALECPHVDEIAIFGSASEKFSQRNISCSIDESIHRFRAVVDQAQIRTTRTNLPVRGYVSAVVACPYQGPIAPSQVAKVVEQMLELGCYEISLGDTIGVGTPGTIRPMLEEVLVRTVSWRLRMNHVEAYVVL
jgi:hydroxymethylglutaryl-CoA lyase